MSFWAALCVHLRYARNSGRVCCLIVQNALNKENGSTSDFRACSSFFELVLGFRALLV